MKTCRPCSIIAPGDKCPSCGAPLSETDAQEIAKITTHRPSTPQPTPHYGLAIGGPILLVIGLVIVGRLISSTHTEPTKASTSTASNYAQTLLASACALDYDSIYPILRAYQTSDLEALQGLVIRGKAITLSEGVKVFVASRESGVASVLVESGRHSGQSCYLPENFLSQ